MLHEIKKYFFDITEAINEIEFFVKDKSYQDFIKNSLVQSAVERKFEIIGEALNRIKKIDEKKLEKITDAYKIIGLRNIIIHGYDIIDSKIIWDAVKYNLSALKREISSLD